MAQLDAHKVQLDLKPQSVAGLIYVAVEQSRSSQPSRDIRVSLSSSLPDVLADDAWIEKSWPTC